MIKINYILLTLITFCNISYSKNQSLNTIHLIGEDHENSECIKLNVKLSEEANNGNIILALEGHYLEEFNSNTFGIENKYAYNLVNVWLIYSNLALHKIANSIASIDPIHSDLLKKRANEHLSPPSQKLSEIIDNIFRQNLDLSSISNKDNKQILKKLLNLNQLLAFSPSPEKEIANIISNHSIEHPFFLDIHPNLSTWIKLFKCIVDLHINELIKKHHDENIDILRKLVINSQKINEYATVYADQLATIDKTIISALIDTQLRNFFNAEMSIMDSNPNLRDRFFVKNIIHIFENQKFQEKPFYVIVGADHVPYLYEELIQKGYQVELNDWGQSAYNRYLKGTLDDRRNNPQIQAYQDKTEL